VGCWLLASSDKFARQAWVHVLSFVDAESVAKRVSLVSHAFHALATEPQLWRRLVLRDFPASASSADSTGKCNLYEGEPDGWRKTYARHWLQRSVHKPKPAWPFSRPRY
jgi:hypothetical protein